MDLYHWQQRFEAWLSQYHGKKMLSRYFTFPAGYGLPRSSWPKRPRRPLVILTACYFHDIVSLAKNHPERSRSSAMAAEKTLAILQSAFPDFPPERYAAVLHAIEAHSFSAAVAPQSEEAKIVQVRSP